MQFNPGSSTGVVDEINDICQSDNNSYPLASKARRVNAALDRFFTLAFKADGRWTFDDTNHDSVPIVTKDMTDGVSKYAIDTIAADILGILRVEVLDANGDGITLPRLDRESVTTESITEKYETAGKPEVFDLVGEYIYIYPAPNYSSSDGLKLYIKRNKSAFTSSDTTKSLGIPSLFHQYICRLASLPFLIEFQKAQKNDIAGMIAADEQEIMAHFKWRTPKTDRIHPNVEDTR